MPSSVDISNSFPSGVGKKRGDITSEYLLETMEASTGVGMGVYWPVVLSGL